MENTNPENFSSANANGNVKKFLGDEPDVKIGDQSTAITAEDKTKNGGNKERPLVKQMCRFYVSQTYCRYGRNCRFSHDRSGYIDRRNSERKYNSKSLSGNLNTSRGSEPIGNTSSSTKKPETEIKTRSHHGTSPIINKYPDMHSEDTVWQESDVASDLPSMYGNPEIPHQSNVIGRQRSLFFYRSNRQTTLHSPAFRNRASGQCRYFVKGFCRQGDKCKFMHQGTNRSKTAEKSETKCAEESSATDEKSTNEICNNLPNCRGVPAIGRHIKLQDLDHNEIVRLRNTEIHQLKKRFPACEVMKSAAEEIFHVIFSPSDPDWSFAVNSVVLEVVFMAEYPREACTIKALEANNLPPILVRHLNKSISDWIKEKHESCLASEKIELLFRPFLRWLDRNLEELFIVGLRKVKQDLLAKEAGIEFVPYNELPGATSMVHCEISGMGTSKHTAKDKQDDSQTTLEESNDTDLGEKEKTAGSNDVKHMQEVDEKGTSVCSRVQEKEIILISELQTDFSSTNAEKDNFSPDVNDLKVTSDRENHSLLVSANPTSEKFSIPKVGTEVKLLGLELTESAAAMACIKVAATLQCSRCKVRHEINTPPKRNNSLNCSKCHNLMQISFQPALLHQFSTVMGYLHLVDCQAVDIPLMECSFYVDCLNCSKQISISGIHYGQQRVTWCLYCNKKISIYTQSVKFHQLQPASNIVATPGHKLTTATKKEKKLIKDPAIQEGKPLPDCGTCKHYKKSYRWLRFPCCGKAYPCDICHNEKETDHEMKYANHMICGFCAKEQPYAGNKPCVICSSNMTKKASSHWEGGMGCRDKITMSREDRQKYSGIGKTISRKAQSQKPKKK